MQFFVRISLILLLIVGAPAYAKEFKLYAMMNDETVVDLADGAKWKMDKGDVFPVVMYKDRQTKIVLQLAGTTFMTETKNVRILKDDEVEAGLVSYRKNVENYLNSAAQKGLPEPGDKKEEKKP